MTIGERLKYLREKKANAGQGVSQDWLEQESGISRKTISQIEGGHTDPAITGILEKLVVALDLSLADFFSSEVPNIYQNHHHRELHEKLQILLEDDGQEAEWLRHAIEREFKLFLEGTDEDHRDKSRKRLSESKKGAVKSGKIST